MRQGKRASLILCLFGVLPVVWLGLAMAPAASGGLPAMISRFTEVMNRPAQIKLCEDSLKTVLILLLVYGLGIGVYLSSRRNYRRGEEHGSAKWGDARAVNKKYQAKEPEKNKVLTQHVQIGLDGRRHRRNLNTMVVGGSGAGKTRAYAKPNLCQANTSFVILDPKGELLRDTGYLLEQKGYEVRVLDLLDMSRSHCYNPFVYLRDDNDVQRLVTNLFKSTTPKGSQSQDPFWDTAASMLLLALIFYLHHEAPPDEQNFPMVMEMLRAGDVREDDDSYQSPLDELFERLEMRNPDHIAVKYYKDYHSGSAKTLKSIQITLAARLEKFNLESIASLTATDELDLPSLGEKKVALFALIPDNDTSFNFLVSLLYTQLFQQLFTLADHKYGGRLPVHVHFLMDEFANVSLPDDFDKILSVMRSREVSVSIILQNLAQLKALFEKQWESITGNCDEFLYLGGNEQSTHKYVAELLGKETIDTNTYGKSTGRSGNYSTNYQITGRELLDAAEVRMLDNSKAILFIRGEKPILDEKYDILKHPSVALTTDGKASPYVHGGTENAVATISFAPAGVELTDPGKDIETMYELLSNEELEAIYLSQEENTNEAVSEKEP
ncbi:VirD4-like conjugal transfer protein, CD1115 family [Lachnoclostridium sp. Marseille-P6806]|uniref:VirD4-like conjugal transfer protein, CD1115 family n=1 Tax=Lachnoclostridium sp. Marseille-P6806 TaxID=2364793 RepID=UPI0010323727|nr:type IV secretory system conjugative DNA transfer family protein [Lachnoclostridium sp. Marseille-P6806]